MNKVTENATWEEGLEIVMEHFKGCIEVAEEEMKKASGDEKEKLEILLNHLSLEAKVVELVIEAWQKKVFHKNPLFHFLATWMSLLAYKTKRAYTIMEDMLISLDSQVKEIEEEGGEFEIIRFGR